ncbi:unnamed protein product [Darwinula stevensoni]|uniref:Peptidase S1 domain-containing protein n=1 Tax=Darwinula stevensoni TaxID=69355 RepID=A0A7R9ABP9_9CRUS|nr:unnamed protein product [Darwinula stevensoni]CAG0899504.1 unnamed protein product [Darwinula stevensoni]
MLFPHTFLTVWIVAITVTKVNERLVLRGGKGVAEGQSREMSMGRGEDRSRERIWSVLASHSLVLRATMEAFVFLRALFLSTLHFPFSALVFSDKIPSASLLPVSPQAAEYGCRLPFACVPFYLCYNGNIITNGEGIFHGRVRRSEPSSPVNDSSNPSQHLDGNCPNFLDVCCLDPNAKPPTTPKPPPYVPRCGNRNYLGAYHNTFNASRELHQYDHEAHYGEFPWMGVVLTTKPDAPEKDLYQCGASLIHPQVVLTAADCVDEFTEFPGKSGLKVRLGEWDTTGANEPYPHQERFVEKIVIHPDYRKGPLYNDIALLFMNDPYELQPHVDTICLPEPGYRRPWGNICVSAGFGKDNFGREGRYRTILKKVELPLVERMECERTLRNTRLGQWFRLHWSFLCAGGVTGHDTCKGDGGGPLVCYDPNKGSWYQVGIVAWGIGCGNAIPGIYVDVAHFTPWIDEEITRYYHLRNLPGPPQAADYGCVFPFACVPFYLCNEGEIVTDIIDVQFGPGKDSSDPPQLVGGNCPNFLDVCCRNPNAKPQTTPMPTPYNSRCGVRNNFSIDVGITFNASHDQHKYDHEAQYGEFPWMGVVLTAKPDAPEKDLYQCGASLIHPQVVLTAADCVDKFAEFPGKSGLKVRLGEWDTTNDYEPYPHQDRFVEKVVIHPDYRKGPLYNDIALLFMNHPYELQLHVDTICLPEPGYRRPWGNICVSTGFGKNSYGKEGQYQIILKKVELPLVEQIECEKRYRSTKLGQWFRLHRSFLCAGGVMGEDTCTGDGGGPLVCYDPDKGSWYQAGIVAWGIGCGNEIPGIYVDVGYFTPWIDEEITRYYHLPKPYWGFDLRQGIPEEGSTGSATNPAVPAQLFSSTLIEEDKIAATSLLPGPQQAAEDGCELPLICIPFYLCDGGNIVTDGEGIIDARASPSESSSTSPKLDRRGPSQLLGKCSNNGDECCSHPNAEPPSTLKSSTERK